jgi:hypothetical protein
MLDKKLLIEPVFQGGSALPVEVSVCLPAVAGVGMGLSLRIKEMTTMRHLS